MKEFLHPHRGYYIKLKRRPFRPPLKTASTGSAYILPDLTAAKSAFAASSSWPLIKALYCP
ncbi:MAG TPA: hypothetical protein VMV70_07300, partial [Gallionella sp.]|nr:hypothetical protein [Gallionella sp.]